MIITLMDLTQNNIDIAHISTSLLFLGKYLYRIDLKQGDIDPTLCYSRKNRYVNLIFYDCDVIVGVRRY